MRPIACPTDSFVRRAFPVSSLALLALATLAPTLPAQDAAIYAMNEKGLVTVNGTTLDQLPGGKWVELVVIGSDRWALRDNGLVYKNGEKLYKLNCDDGKDKVNEGKWVGLAVLADEVWALSGRGYLARDGECVAQFANDGFEFTALFSGADRLCSLRADGALFVDMVAQPVFAFKAGPGLEDAAEGEADDTLWRSGEVGPDGMVYVLRRDGKVMAGVPVVGETGDGVLVASLPFGTSTSSGLLYEDLFFTEDGRWNVLRARGDLYNKDNTLNPTIEFKGGSGSGSKDRMVEGLGLPPVGGTLTDESFFALRRNGRLYRETSDTSVYQLKKSGYGQLAFATEGPDLSNVKNALPVVTTYKVQAVEGAAVAFPILANDTDKASEDLVVTLDEESLPEGAVYDPETRTVTWDDPVKGSSKVKVTVDDGVGKPVKKAFPIKVAAASTNPDKNTKPRLSAIKNARALVGFELRLPILASDRDGDALTISVDESKPPFDRGATFDPETSTFVWPDPELADVGSYSIKFTVSDGSASASTTVKLTVVSSFLGF